MNVTYSKKIISMNTDKDFQFKSNSNQDNIVVREINSDDEN